jgi:hypothetical protein
MTIDEVANQLATRLTRIFLKDERGRRPVYGRDARLQQDPQFRDYVLFFEYFDGDTGRGVGASHQTGWTGLVARLLMPRYARRVPKPLDHPDITLIGAPRAPRNPAGQARWPAPGTGGLPPKAPK